MKPALSNFLLTATHTLLHILRTESPRGHDDGGSSMRYVRLPFQFASKNATNPCACIAGRTPCAGTSGHGQNQATVLRPHWASLLPCCPHHPAVAATLGAGLLPRGPLESPLKTSETSPYPPEDPRWPRCPERGRRGRGRVSGFRPRHPLHPPKTRSRRASEGPDSHRRIAAYVWI